MDDAARTAFLMAQAISALAEIEAMKIENHGREVAGCAPAHTAEDFRDVPRRFGLEHNTAIAYLMGRG